MDNNSTRAENVTNTSSRYTRGGTTDIYNTRVGWWERLVMQPDPTDLFFDITPDCERRPDLISFKLYETPNYAWLVLQFNNIVDINEELITGVTLKLLTSSRLNTILLANSVGGRRVEN